MTSTQVANAPLCAVLSLVVHRIDAPNQVLLGVRRGSATSARHPDVLSTPTMRVPESIMEALLRSAELETPTEFGQVIYAAPGRVAAIGMPMALADPLAFATEALLARKLRVGEHLVSGRLRGHVNASAVTLDIVYDPASDGAPERTLMLSASVMVDVGADLIQGPAESYSSLHWVDATNVADAVARKDVLALVPHLGLEVCLHGLCVRSAAAVLEGAGGAVGLKP